MADSTSKPKPTSNREANLEAIEELHRRLEENARAGSDEAIAKQHSKGKLTIPERLDLLFDPDAPRFELGAFAAQGGYPEHGRIESAGVRTVLGQVSDHDCIVIANDSMVKSGTWFPLTIKKILRAQQIGMENRLPLIYLVDSGGLFLPLQHDSFSGPRPRRTHLLQQCAPFSDGSAADRGGHGPVRGGRGIHSGSL